ncbi:hypothetical protein METHB2_180060 [Candidatus Methylobacter favarea]|uniref:Uncharacterized protein n=1 Tax=Candidatus Methylobacter favarea TaxID=2707345 RepID=A0A8S0XRM6_9GAMM|nr:hypothetical protein METHB2_180060 [Candidatus Methylobacter favarea]
MTYLNQSYDDRERYARFIGNILLDLFRIASWEVRDIKHLFYSAMIRKALNSVLGRKPY